MKFIVVGVLTILPIDVGSLVGDGVTAPAPTHLIEKFIGLGEVNYAHSFLVEGG